MHSTRQQKYNKKKTFSYVCPKCFERCDLTFNMNITLTDCSALENEFHFAGLTNHVFCKQCGSLMFNCDSRIVNDIISLNKNGIKTEYCCQGHKVEPFISRDFVKSIENKHVRNYEISNMNYCLRPYIMFNLDDTFDYNKVIDGASSKFENVDPPVIYFADALLLAILKSGSKEFPKDDFVSESTINEFAKSYIPFTYEIIIEEDGKYSEHSYDKYELCDFISAIKNYCFNISTYSEERSISVIIANDSYQKGKAYDKILLEKYDHGDKYIISLLKNLAGIANYLNWVDPDELVPSKVGTNPASILSVIRQIAGMQNRIAKCRQHNIYIFDDFAILFSRKYNSAYMLAKDISPDTIAGKVYNKLYSIPRYIIMHTPIDISEYSDEVITRLVYHDLSIMRKIVDERSGDIIW